MANRHGLIAVDLLTIPPRPSDNEKLRRPASIRHLERAQSLTGKGDSCL